MEQKDCGGINIAEPECKLVSEMPPDYQEQVRAFFESKGIPCPPLESTTTHIGPW